MSERVRLAGSRHEHEDASRRRAMAGSVSVRRVDGSAGTVTATTQRVVSCSAGERGKRDAVWPSSPRPRSIRSNGGL